MSSWHNAFSIKSVDFSLYPFKIEHGHKIQLNCLNQTNWNYYHSKLKPKKDNVHLNYR